MPAEATSTHPLKFRNVLLGKANPHDWGVAGLYVVLVVLWHCTVLPLSLVLIEWEVSNWLQGGWAVLSISAARVCATAATSVTAMVTMFFVQALGGLVAFRLFTNKLKPAFGWFAQSWWRTCLWGTLGVLTTGMLLAQVVPTDDDYNATVLYIAMLWMACGAMIPVVLFRENLKTQPAGLCLKCGVRDHTTGTENCSQCKRLRLEHRLRQSPWRPVCPECGYSLRRLSESRCPECGSDFPTKRKMFKRWAVLRLPWDRLPREFVVKSYVKSILCLVFTPAAAARGLTIPDRWGRTFRWAVFHYMLAVLLAALLSNGQQYLGWLAPKIIPSLSEYRIFWHWNERSMEQMSMWTGHTLIAWSVLLLMPVIIGCAVSYVMPGRIRAARLGGIKWSLYSIPVYLLAILGWYVYAFALAPDPMRFTPRTPWFRFPAEAMPVWMPIFIYGAWWAVGISANPFNRNRRILACLSYFWVYYGSWVVASRILFPDGGLDSLL